MDTGEQILSEIVSRLRQESGIEKIVLFGSRARGQARPESDYDLLVVKRSDEPRHRRAAPYYALLSDLPAEVEVVVYTPDEVEDWSRVPMAFVTTAIREGKVIYER
jgi:uncharacterized protein